jgi:ABC-type Fe3+/spermidine/putrescine transport system ATPase subunit
MYPTKISAAPGSRVTVLLRPEGARLVDAAHTADPGKTIIRGMVTQRAFKGGHFNLTVQTDPGQVFSFDLIPEDLLPVPGQRVRLLMRPSAMVLLPGHE